MFVHRTKLPHLLAPEHYFSQQQYEREKQVLFRPLWMLAAHHSDLAQAGDFVTREIFGLPIILRNFDGHLRCFLNVCPHRHSRLTHTIAGNSPALKCQYHGWEFTEDGTTGKIPGAQHFRPMPGGPECLKSFSIHQCGPFVFVATTESPPDFDDQLATVLTPLNEYPSDRWHHCETWTYDFSANWKVIVENTIESYHLESVHTNSFRFDQREIKHEIHDVGVVMDAKLLSPKWKERVAERMLSPIVSDFSHRYRMYHAFPNTFVMRIDTMLQSMTVVPTSPTSCHVRVSVFSLKSARENLMSKAVTRFWGWQKTRAVKRILSEDAALYPDIQHGLEHSPFQGTVSTQEELIHAFHRYVLAKCQDLVPEDSKLPT